MLVDVVNNAQNNAVWLITWAVCAIVLVFITWWRLPKIATRVLRWIDDLLPGDFPDLHTPIGRWISVVVSLVIVLIATVQTTDTGRTRQGRSGTGGRCCARRLTGCRARRRREAWKAARCRRPPRTSTAPSA